MSQQREHFEQSFQDAVKAGLQACRAGDSLRSRLQQSLANEQQKAPPGIEEEQVSQFETRLTLAIESSLDWAAADEVAYRVENAVHQETGLEVWSERSLHLRHQAGEPSSQSLYLQALRNAIKKSQDKIVASPSCRQRIIDALAAEAKPAPLDKKVVPLTAARSRWKRAVAAVASVAAGFALIFGTLVGGAEEALAETVRNDHQRCCSALKASKVQRCAPYQNALYGPLPAAKVSSKWTLVASRMCHGPDSGPMVHNVYMLDGKSLSLHFIPPTAGQAKTPDSNPREIANDEFPVVAWETSGWTVTACSSDLDKAGLMTALGLN